MYALPCTCGQILSVSPGQAGDQTTCPNCQTIVKIPQLRELRLLPKTDSPTTTPPVAEHAFPLRMLFAVMGFIALVFGAFGTFALVSALMIPIEYDTDKFVEYNEAVMLSTSTEDLVTRWEQLVRRPLGDRQPFPYQVQANTKASWNWWMTFGYSIAGVALLIAIGIAILERRRTPPSVAA